MTCFMTSYSRKAHGYLSLTKLRQLMHSKECSITYIFVEENTDMGLRKAIFRYCNAISEVSMSLDAYNDEKLIHDA